MALPVAAVLAMLALGPQGAPAWGEPAVVADVQVQALGPAEAHVLRIRSSGALPFDVLPSPAGQVLVRLHRARLGAIGAVEAAAFGTIALTEAPGERLLLRIDLADPGYRARVTQGDHESVVEVRISR